MSDTMTNQGDDINSQQINASGDTAARDATTFNQQGQRVETQINVAGTFIASTTPPVLALHQLPPPPADFTGRAADLDAILSDIEHGALISGVRGMGGLGKTALALVIAERLKVKYPDAQFFIPLRGVSDAPVKSLDAMQSVIRAYHPTTQLPDDATQIAALYRSVLEGQRAIMLLDDAKDGAQITPLLPPKSCLVLITTRQHFHMPGLHARNLEALLLDEAIALLLKIAPRIEQHASDIAILCGSLPLALRAAASLIAISPDLDPTEYINRLHNTRTRLAQIGVEGIEIGVQASLELSFDQLPQKVARVFCQLAVFPTSFDAPAEEVIADDPNHVSLSKLVKQSLVLFDQSSKRYYLHDLVRVFAGRHLSIVTRKKAERRHSHYYLHVASETDRMYDTLSSGQILALTLFDLEWKNIQLGQDWTTTHANDETSTMKLCNEYALSAVHCRALRQHPSQAIIWSEAALVAATRLRDKKAQAHHLGNLGFSHATLGETSRAVNLYEQQLSIARLIRHLPSEANALNNLGLAFLSLNETHRAKECFEQSLKIKRQIGDRRGEGNTLGNLGLLCHQQGDVDPEIEYHTQWLRISKEIGDHWGEGKALGNLASAYADKGELSKAIETYQQALVIFKKIGSLQDIAIILNNIGSIFSKRSETSYAISFYEQARDIAHQSGNVRSEAIALDSLAREYASLGDLSRALTYLEQLLTIEQETDNKLGVVAALESLGVAYAEAKETQKAIAAFMQQLEIFQQGRDRKGEAHALGNLGVAYFSHGDNTKAIELYTAAMQIFQEISDQRGEGQCLGNLGNVYVNLGETRKAIEFYEQYLAIARDIGDRRGEGNASFSMALTLDKLSERAQAIPHAEAALKIFEAIEDPNVEMVRQALAEWKAVT